jgi:ABC-type nitrate/sulfonate/bicarbonate transport system ATPase subunit
MVSNATGTATAGGAGKEGSAGITRLADVDAHPHPMRSQAPVSIHITGTEVRYGDHLALARVDLDVQVGEFVCLLGPSGCGKTTLLNAIAGFVEPSAGIIEVNGAEVREPGRERGVVFQEYALFPWLTVERNIQYGPKLRGVRGAELKTISDKYCALVGLQGAAQRYPNQLSGGMRQRVAIARALANRPQILLMDEPFGALDAMTRQTLQEELLKIWEIERLTFVFVTHSIAEAVFLADRIVVMTAHPGTVKEVIVNRAPRPRSRTSEEHFEMYRLIDTLFQEEAARAAAAHP